MKKIQVSKNSWHHKLVSYAYGYNPHIESLCEYFWTVVLCTVLCWLWVPQRWIGEVIPRRKHNDWNMFGHVVMFGMNLLSVILIGVTIADYNKIIENMTLALAILGIIAGMAAFGFGVWGLARFSYHKYEYSDFATRDRGPNIVIEFAKATKDKYCPMIEWVDDEKK